VGNNVPLIVRRCAQVSSGVQHGSKLSGLLVGCSATQKSPLAIEVLGNLLEGGVASFDVELPDYKSLESKPDGIHDVVLPINGLERDGVDIAVEEEREIDGQEHDSQTLSAH
jgi:hypothetical protein